MAVVATDDERIAECCRGFGADVIMTSESCRNGLILSFPKWINNLMESTFICVSTCTKAMTVTAETLEFSWNCKPVYEGVYTRLLQHSAFV